jgi:hypothetical protein
LSPIAESALKQEVIYAFENAVESRLARPTIALEAELSQPIRAVVVAPIRDGRLRTAATQNSDAGEQQNREKLVTTALRLSEVRDK